MAVWATPDKVAFATPVAVMIEMLGIEPPAAGPGPFALGADGALEDLVRDAGFTDVVAGTALAVYETASAEACTQWVRDVAPPITELIADQPALSPAGGLGPRHAMRGHPSEAPTAPSGSRAPPSGSAHGYRPEPPLQNDGHVVLAEFEASGGLGDDALMARFAHAFGPHTPDATYVTHSFPEQLAVLGEVQMNYVAVGDPSKPALLLIPGQSESWWGYEGALPLLAEHFQALRCRPPRPGALEPNARSLHARQHGQRPRPLHRHRHRPAVLVSGLSSGGVLSAWLSAYAKPGQVLAAHYEDPPLFASETNPATGQGIRQAIGAMFELWSSYLGPQW